MGYTDDLRDSSFDFKRVVWPVIQPMIGKGDFMLVEGNASDDMRMKLDQLAGIDGWHVVNDKGMRGIACRVQWVNHLGQSWNTFTIRRSRATGSVTEYEKRRSAIHSQKGWLYPHLTVQAYILKPRSRGPLVSVAIASTEDLIDAIDCGLSISRTNHSDGNSFEAIHWDVLETHGYRIRSYFAGLSPDGRLRPGTQDPAREAGRVRPLPVRRPGLPKGTGRSGYEGPVYS